MVIVDVLSAGSISAATLLSWITSRTDQASKLFLDYCILIYKLKAYDMGKGSFNLDWWGCVLKYST